MGRKGTFRRQTWPTNGTEKAVKGKFLHYNWFPGVSLRRFNGKLICFRDITCRSVF